MWQSRDTNALLVELRTDPTILEGNLELCPKDIKDCLPFNSAIALLGLYPKEIRKKSCTRIFIAMLFVVAKNWKMRGCPSIGE